MKTVREVISEFYEALQNAFKNEKADFARLHLDDQVTIYGLQETYVGRNAVEAAFNQFISQMSHINIWKQYFDSDSCCTLMDGVTRFSLTTLPIVQWILVRNEKIVEIRPLYDTVAWGKINHVQK